jgi:hypothetical protein
MKEKRKMHRGKSSLRKSEKSEIEKLTDGELLALSSISMNKEEIKEIITLIRDETGDIESFFSEDMTLADIVQLLDKNISRKQLVQLITSEDPKSEIKKILG